MPLELITPPATEPISYIQVLDHLRINPYDETIDEASITYIDTLIEAVRNDVEGFLNRALITQTWKYYLDGWPNGNRIEIPKPPLQSVTSVYYIDSTGTPILWDTGEYIEDIICHRGGITLGYGKSYPTAILYPSNPIAIEFICGYGDLAEDVPKRIIQAMLLQVGDLYENRETIIIGQTIQKLDTVERLLYPFKVWV